MASKICILHILTLVSIFLPLAKSIVSDFPAIFNFGDSNSDTGELVATGIETLLPPNGQNYFHKPSGRYCDGRLIIDFLVRSMDLPFLNAYLDSIGTPNFRKGCNFAAAASAIRPITGSASPFSLGIQVAQFQRLKARVLELELLPKGKKLGKRLPKKDFFEKGLYTFDIGQNDIASAFFSKSLDQIIASIPEILAEFETGIEKLYEQGARNFWIHNTGPLGCLPQNVAIFGTDESKLDEYGCVSQHNQGAKAFNKQLLALSKKLEGKYSDANFAYVDIFTIKYNLIANYSQYGFEHPIRACCGYGGPPLNYDSRISCGQTKILNGTSVTVKGCSDSSKYISWDGIHYTQAANDHVSSEILTGKYSDPPFFENLMF
ncbi:GDSL esterase/lipase At1g54790-like [Castanea sativa]|uniref:GDSL esterase/lipase At1g54790-like n=1 Tax=Castanea sativa TaxID=21020 RepID=UPI003F64BC0B